MAVSIEEALDRLDRNISPLASEIIPIELSPGRVAAASYVATFNLPRFDNSAMDGYAVMVGDQGKEVRSDKVIYAGDDTYDTLQEGEAIRIMTGAPVPKNCEAIVPIEEVRIDGALVELPEAIRSGAHVRIAGEDIKKGECYIEEGERITGYHTALFASQGVTHISVRRKVRVAVFGTGDELRPHYEHIEAHQLYNSNAPMFLARAEELGCNSSYIGGGSDTIQSLKSCISGALNADLIITSGGVSVGDKDFTKEAFTQLGMVTLFSGVSIKPGKPTTVGKIGNTMIVNLPGNPLAAMVNFEIFVKSIIQKLSGTSARYPGIVESRMGIDFSIKPGRYTVLLGSYDGRTFTPLPSQSPGMVSPLQEADGMIIVHPDVSLLQKGKRVSVLPIKWRLEAKKNMGIFTK
jgi:molybdopterin molybdotransferase